MLNKCQQPIFIRIFYTRNIIFCTKTINSLHIKYNFFLTNWKKLHKDDNRRRNYNCLKRIAEVCTRKSAQNQKTQALCRRQKTKSLCHSAKIARIRICHKLCSGFVKTCHKHCTKPKNTSTVPFGKKPLQQTKSDLYCPHLQIQNCIAKYIFYTLVLCSLFKDNCLISSREINF